MQYDNEEELIKLLNTQPKPYLPYLETKYMNFPPMMLPISLGTMRDLRYYYNMEEPKELRFYSDDEFDDVTYQMTEIDNRKLFLLCNGKYIQGFVGVFYFKYDDGRIEAFTFSDLYSKFATKLIEM